MVSLGSSRVEANVFGSGGGCQRQAGTAPKTITRGEGIEKWEPGVLRVPSVPFKDRCLLQSPTRLTWRARWPIPCRGYTGFLPSHVARESSGHATKRATGEHARPGSARSSARRICRSTEMPQRIMGSGRTQPSSVSTLSPQFPGPSRPQTRGSSGCNLMLIVGGCGRFPPQQLASASCWGTVRTMYVYG